MTEAARGARVMGMDRSAVQEIGEISQHVDAVIQCLVNVRHSLRDVLLGKDSSAHFLHRVERFLREVDAFPRVAQANDEVIRSRSAAVRLENVLQALLSADVLLRGDAEVSNGDGCSEIDSRQQPADGHGE